MRFQRSILGFGRFGLIASAVLAALLFAAILGVDFPLLVISAMNRAAGAPGVDLYVFWVHQPAALLLLRPGFTLLAFIYTAVGFHIAPIRFGWLAWVSLLIWALLHTSGPWLYSIKLPFTAAMQGSEVLVGINPSLTATIHPRFLVLADLLLELPTLALLYWISRSTRLVAAAGALFVLTAAFEIGLTTTAPQTSPLQPLPSSVGILWHAALASIVLSWSIHRRRVASRLSATACPECGFDLVSSPTRCPECGRLPQHA